MESLPKEELVELLFWKRLKKQLPFVKVGAIPGYSVSENGVTTLEEELIKLSDRLSEVNDNGEFEPIVQNPDLHHTYERLRIKNKISITSKEELGSVYAKLSAANKELRKRDAEIADLKDELKKVNAQLEQLTFISSHDLQEPVRKIQFFSDLLLTEGSELNEQARIYSTKINTSASRMSALIKDLFNFSILSKKSDKKSVRVDLTEVVKNVLLEFTDIIARKKAVINCSSLCTIYGEPFQLSRLFHHIIGNALKFDKGNLVIDIACREDVPEDFIKYPTLDKNKHYAAITVQENGMGFHQKYSAKIFVLFQRLNYENDIAGTGTGLSIAKRIVENHKGFIFAKGKVNEGTTFTLFLPFAPQFLLD